MNRFLLVIGVIFIIGAYTSCDEPERTILTPDERNMLDSLYSTRVPYARKEADSICDATYQTIFDSAADSIKEVYISQIREIMEEG